MSNIIVWVHEDCLTPTNPALTANNGAPALFVFDDAHLAEAKVSLKRVMFIYECLLEMPVAIRRGNPVDALLAFAREHSASRIVTTDSISPRFQGICDALRKGLPEGGRLEIISTEPFVNPTRALDLRRFSRYWSAVRNLALKK